MGEIQYNWEEMDSLINEYNSSIEFIDNILTELKCIEDIYIFQYSGQAREAILPELFDKIKKHMELLKICYTGVAGYVKNAKDTMKTIDEGLTELFE